MLENIKVGDFLEFQGKNMHGFRQHYCYPIASINEEKKTLEFINGYSMQYNLAFMSHFWHVPKKIHVRRHAGPAHQVVNVSDLKPGEYFRFYGKKQVYLVSDIKARGEWIYSKTSDVWGSYRNISKKSKRLVEIGFEY